MSWRFILDGEVQLSKYDLHAADYHLVAVDLRNLPEVEKKLEESHLDKWVLHIEIFKGVRNVYLKVNLFILKNFVIVILWIYGLFPLPVLFLVSDFLSDLMGCM